MAATALRPDGGRWLRGVGRFAMRASGPVRLAAAPARPSRAERVHARLHRARLPVLDVQDEAADGARTTTAMARNSTACIRPAPLPTSVRCCASSPQLSPPSQDSRFQIGTVRFSSSMAKRAASNASPRCGADTATTTAASPTSTTPVRCSRPPGRPPATRRTSAAMAPGGRAGLVVGLVLEPVDARPAFGVIARVPVKVTVAPQSGSTTHSRRDSDGSGRR